MPIDNLPLVTLLFGVSVEDVVGDNVDRVGILGWQEVGQDCSDCWHHSTEDYQLENSGRGGYGEEGVS